MIVFSSETIGAIKWRVIDPPAHRSVPPDEDDPMHPDQHGGDLPPGDIPIGDEPGDPLDGDNQPDYNTGPDPDDNDDDDDDQECIIPDDYGPPPDDDLDMPGIQDSGEIHNPSTPPTPFSDPDVPMSRLLILDKMMILHQDLILLLNQFEFKGNRDRFLLILLVPYQRQRLR